MSNGHQIDNLDLQILKALEADARVPYLELARSLEVSGGTIHQRIDRLRNAGIIQGSGFKISYLALGHQVSAILGIHLKSAKDNQVVVHELEKMDEVVEAYYTTGHYALIVKIVTQSIQTFHQFLMERLQAIPEISSTESFICLDQPISRNPKLTSQK